jgi:hypothetical protein
MKAGVGVASAVMAVVEVEAEVGETGTIEDGRRNGVAAEAGVGICRPGGCGEAVWEAASAVAGAVVCPGISILVEAAVEQWLQPEAVVRLHQQVGLWHQPAVARLLLVL